MKPTTLQQFDAAFALIKDESNWIQNNLKRYKNGSVCYCSIGAMFKILDTNADEVSLFDEPIYLALSQASNELSGNESVVNYNDQHTHAEVVTMWQRARSLLVQ